jgi:hypothetical protein
VRLEHCLKIAERIIEQQLTAAEIRAFESAVVAVERAAAAATELDQGCAAEVATVTEAVGAEAVEAEAGAEAGTDAEAAVEVAVEVEFEVEADAVVGSVAAGCDGSGSRIWAGDVGGAAATGAKVGGPEGRPSPAGLDERDRRVRLAPVEVD